MLACHGEADSGTGNDVRVGDGTTAFDMELAAEDEATLPELAPVHDFD